MALVSTIEKLTSARVLRTLKTRLVAKQICKAESTTKIQSMGDTVYFPSLNTPAVNTYTGTVTYEEVLDGTVALLINQSDYFAFKIGKIEDFQSTIDVEGSQTDEAAYRLAKKADQYMLGLYGDAELKYTKNGVTSANVLEVVSSIIRKLDEADVVGGQRWMVIPPWMAEKLNLAGVKFQINNGMDGERGGLSWADYLETKVIISNNLVTTGSEGSLNTQCMAGSYNAIVYADQIMDTEIIEKFENSFGKGIRGLHVYGAKVIKGMELVHANLTQGAEA